MRSIHTHCLGQKVGCSYWVVKKISEIVKKWTDGNTFITGDLVGNGYELWAHSEEGLDQAGVDALDSFVEGVRYALGFHGSQNNEQST